MLGILLANTGSPAAPPPRAVRAYLAQFLSDRRVVNLPPALWLPVLHAVILTVRSPRSARLYRRIWEQDGSPLVANTLRLAGVLQTHLASLVPGGCRVMAGMRYGQPSIASALRSLCAAGCDDLLILPLFPQYSSTTTASMFDAVFAELRTWLHIPHLRLVNHYYDHPDYIQAIAVGLQDAWSAEGMPRTLLFSFHGIPRRYVQRGDPYEKQCHDTARLVASALGLPETAWQVTFQSRFGLNRWLGPSTIETLLALAHANTDRVDIIAPGFAIDCLETLDELAHEARRQFLAAGGQELCYLPALNATQRHVETLAQVILQSTSL